MKNAVKTRLALKIFLIALLMLPFFLSAQKHTPPLPVELFTGNEALYFQAVVKKSFGENSPFNFFTVASYTANYDNPKEEFRLVMPVQVSFNFDNGLGLMAGTDINSVSGFSPIVGPQFNYVSGAFLAVTVASIFLNESRDFKIFGLYEFTPELNETWSVYTRLQFIYKHSWENGFHSRSYVYMRIGLQKGPAIFGLGANLDRFGPQKSFTDNYGVFFRWEFK